MSAPYLFANWKMYLNDEESQAMARDLATAWKKLNLKATTAVFPSALSLLGVKKLLDKAGIATGAQNVFWIDKGGYTGETSAAMFNQVGCTYALVGHSERRIVFNESNSEVRQKLEAILATDITPVLCVGETLAERKDGEFELVLEAQLRSAFMHLTWPAGRELIIAYEPVWAISTGESCDPDEAGRVATLIQKYVHGLLADVDPIILYGGSVREDNVANYLAEKSIKGVLVGGASTKLSSWLEIIKQVT